MKIATFVSLFLSENATFVSLFLSENATFVSLFLSENATFVGKRVGQKIPLMVFYLGEKRDHCWSFCRSKDIFNGLF